MKPQKKPRPAFALHPRAIYGPRPTFTLHLFDDAGNPERVITGVQPTLTTQQSWLKEVFEPLAHQLAQWRDTEDRKKSKDNATLPPTG